MDLITKNNEIYISFLRKMEEMDKTVGEVLKNGQPAPGSERYLTDRELSRLLSISRRTLQEYRTTGKIPYFMIGGKVLYRESDMENLLRENYHSKQEDF